MNMLVSYNWIREFVGLKESPEDFARRISLSGPSVERLYPQGSQFDGMVIGRIVEVKPHPNADKLKIAVTDLGTERSNIVCGGSNLTVDMKVVVALSGAMVRWHGSGEPVRLESTEIRGVRSDGMICGANEIGLEEAFPHAEREILDMSWCKAKPGTRLAKALDLDDTVFDIEVTTNRPDAFSAVGLAREAAAIFEVPFLHKEALVPSLAKSVDPLPLTVLNDELKLCTRYQAVVMDGIEVGPSPWWLKSRLHLAGIRSINNVVDITNYVMLELGQPMHAFDYDTLTGNTIRIRQARPKESIRLLDGSQKSLAASHLVIADEDKPIAVAGVMGGEDTGVTDRTKRIVFEAATFDPVSVRRTGRDLDLRSDSSLRFEKGLPEEQTQTALARAIELCQKVACGRMVSTVFDLRSTPHKKVKYSFRPERAEQLIGVKVPTVRMVKILKSLGFGVTRRSPFRKGKALYDVEVPYWRVRDIEGERDFAEEIARIYGYSNLPSEIPNGELPVDPVDPVLLSEGQLKRFFASLGFTEILNYSLVSSELLAKAGYDAKDCLRLSNPLSSDFEFLRPSLIPGLLETVNENSGLFPDGEVFEISNVYIKNAGANLPDERLVVLLAAYGPDDDGDRLFRRVKGVLEAEFGVMHRRVEMCREVSVESRLWNPGRTVDLYVGDTAIGTLGEIHPEVLESFGIDGRVCTAEFDLSVLVGAAATETRYQPIPLFPPIRRDLSVIVPEAVEYGAVETAISGVSDVLREIRLFDIYAGEGIPDGHKSFSLHLTFRHDDRTLTAEEIDGEVGKIVKLLAGKLQARLRD
ncbi:phenylalanine--tRNA ligase subunit beta [Candidatus Uhrbacteria bacterium CG_4_10_14_0_8_um_filter_58_22]|uniref:Phenylalanine--tRNA ligase beta subunit n=1 Tax=Candidatus Uhrbacteria bacterium CG_4_10_14_0_8_um_filter_58_22 TaxID=1975029 RepID=A0A2M7QAJ7_9BACT|nr:MAG: phenylalanine--tRNA ligase subunit beta [Parcubacteria group bacterium CG1_02_58_44]PIY63149.1 MAG: phenylalanine--tRNA ligase subunit beta [Candidatus Uhrbacteria bacterium CG_4_10_14_0_8_um_filter_58_22]